MSDFTTGAHECFCDRQYKDANKLESCGDCPRDYIPGAWDARRKYIEEHSKMTDRYENIRKALAMGPTPGPWKWWEQEGFGYCCVNPRDGGPLIAKCDVRDPFDPEQRANAALIGACDPDTIRVLLDERDALAAENARLREVLAALIIWIPPEDTYRRLGFDPETPMKVVEEAWAAIEQEAGRG